MGKNRNLIKKGVPVINQCDANIEKAKSTIIKEGKIAKNLQNLGIGETAVGGLATVVNGFKLLGAVMHYDAVLELGAEPLAEGYELNAVLGALGGAVLFGAGVYTLNRAEKHFAEKQIAEDAMKFNIDKRNAIMSRLEGIGQELDDKNFKPTEVFNDEQLTQIRNDNPIIETKSAIGEDVKISEYFKTNAFEGSFEEGK